jgi:uronate dehydrogenase
MQKKILLTGAAGQIGFRFITYAGSRYHFRLADRSIENLLPFEAEGHEVFQLNIADPDACQQACTGMDMVIHLAANPSPQAQFYESLLDDNIKGTYNIFRAASDQRCQRVIYASSVQAVEAYTTDTQIHPEMSVRPKNLYGVSKCFGEALASYFAYNENLSAIAIRIGAFTHEEDYDTPRSARDLSAFVSARDLYHLFERCLEEPEITFAIVHGLSDNRFKRLDLTATKTILHYHPKDDAFQIFGIGLQE